MSGSVRFLGLLVCALALASTPASAQDDTFAQRRSAARAQVVAGLTELARWCDSKQLYLERDDLYARLIGLDPEHAEARKGLRHKKGADGKWPAPGPTKSANRNAKALAEYPPLRAAVVGPYCDTMLALVDGDGGAPGQRASVYDEILLVDPDEPRVHERLGDVQVDGKWLMKETVAAKQRRGKIREVVKSCLDSVPRGTSTSASGDEAQLVGAWKCALATDGVRVLSTTDGCERMVQVVQTANALLEGLFGTGSSYPGQYTIYLLQPGEKALFLDRMPGIPAKDRQRMLATVGGGIPGTANNAIWDADPNVRADMAVRLSYQGLLRSTFGVGPTQGAFASEGLGLYLTREILGTRLTWWVVPGKAPRGEFFSEAVVTPDVEAMATRARLMQGEANWLNEARKLFDTGAAPHLAQVTKRKLDSMSVADIVVSYALVSYVVEGRPEQAREFFSLVGSDSADAASKAVFELTLPELEKRLRRWLAEAR